MAPKSPLLGSDVPDSKGKLPILKHLWHTIVLGLASGVGLTAVLSHAAAWRMGGASVANRPAALVFPCLSSTKGVFTIKPFPREAGMMIRPNQLFQNDQGARRRVASHCCALRGRANTETP